jgi:hypothetical protein
MKVSPQARGAGVRKAARDETARCQGRAAPHATLWGFAQGEGGAGGADCWREVTVGPKIGHEVWPLRPLGYPDKGNCSDTVIDDGTNTRVAARPFKSEHKQSATRYGESRTVVTMYRS